MSLCESRPETTNSVSGLIKNGNLSLILSFSNGALISDYSCDHNNKIVVSSNASSGFEPIALASICGKERVIGGDLP
ncbi:MAG: hypothetical protein LBQ27_03545 [Clostridiales bacterium]|nr:hypothetical protein [Clostridiales bacterium]